MKGSNCEGNSVENNYIYSTFIFIREMKFFIAKDLLTFGQKSFVYTCNTCNVKDPFTINVSITCHQSG